MSHPFDRYQGFVDVDQLKEFSAKPLRKCLRVNTLKMSVVTFDNYSKQLGWQVEQVPWCKEGFFIDREDRATPLGKDIYHLLGHTYMQEASSMLPVALLDPKPGDIVLDMAAAPGSKSTQIAALMQGRGVLVSNDMQEKRLWTLRDALNRLGATNVIVTKKVGQWFSKNMVGRFDRVLIDAPCTGQGTARKDPSALTYCSEHSIGKNAALQRQLLESAIHATKIGGRIVYSTCTLTPEENEEVMLSALKKFAGQIEVVDPREMENGKWKVESAIEASVKVQQSLGGTSHPFLRLWPQTYNSEGFFCAVLTKTAPTREAIKTDLIKPYEEILPKSRLRDMQAFLEDRYGTDFLEEDEVVLEDRGRLWLSTKETHRFKLPCPRQMVGCPFGKKMTKTPVMIDHDLITLRGHKATKGIASVTEEQWKVLRSGKDTECDAELLGHIIIRLNDLSCARGLARDGHLKNHLPRWLVQMGS